MSTVNWSTIDATDTELYHIDIDNTNATLLLWLNDNESQLVTVNFELVETIHRTETDSWKDVHFECEDKHLQQLLEDLNFNEWLMEELSLQSTDFYEVLQNAGIPPQIIVAALAHFRIMRNAGGYSPHTCLESAAHNACKRALDLGAITIDQAVAFMHSKKWDV